ncbi:alanine dehydrogenase [Sporobacter termitidis DSM 10068]|uniref:Alanine dehydrogenase n=1 Tax=Sporobacter termitidis DSM 10068 TaxID=1123282 RepID=A0A1M5ZAR8_9FIRM|nr:alanine dehydrogenase [Sporobacter termitidis]SHI21317.1 alanine dehydrogenase [Sporobacter termitidis DSM 10068]
MKIGIPKEIKNNENRVAITPAGVYALHKLGHDVLIEQSAGEGSGITDGAYEAAGAATLPEAAAVYDAADLIVKVKEPIEPEYQYFKEGQSLFAYLHLAPNPGLTALLQKKKITAIAYETVQLPGGAHPLLSPMSEVAGRMSVQVGADLLQKYKGGEGILLGGVPGVRCAEVLIIGGGVVGANAAKMASGLGAHVTVMDLSKDRLNYLDDIFAGRVATMLYDEYNAAEMVETADLLVGAVLVTGAKAPKTVSEDMVKSMKKGAVIVDVAIDQGGSIATIDRVTTHDNPCYEKYGVVHYSVANMPGAVPKTSTWALTGATLPYLTRLAEKGVAKALLEDKSFLSGLNTHNGCITCAPIAECFNQDCVPAEKSLAGMQRTA